MRKLPGAKPPFTWSDEPFLIRLLSPPLPGKSLPFGSTQSYPVELTGDVPSADRRHTSLSEPSGTRSMDPRSPTQKRRNFLGLAPPSVSSSGAVHFSFLHWPLLHSLSSWQSSPSPLPD